MMKTVVSTPNAPAAIGPYSQAIAVGDLLFCSGQVPIDPATGQIVGDTAADQCRQVLTNVKNLLEAGGSSLAQVVKCTVFLVTMDDFASMNEVYATFFPDKPPARSTVAVVGLPRGVRVEIEALALRTGG